MKFLEKMSQDKRFRLQPTLTASRLPVLTRATKNALIEEVERDLSMGKCPARMLKERYKKIHRENPLMLESIREMVECFPSYMQFNVATALTDEYFLLDSQRMRDKIWEYFSKPVN